MIGVTRKQRELLDFIGERMAVDGVSPSFEEMKEAMGLKSKSGIHRLLDALGERGFIQRLPNRARAIEILEAPRRVLTPRSDRPLGHLSDDELLTELEYRGSAINADAVHLVFHSFFVIEKFCAEYPGDLANKIRPFLLRTPDEAIERAAA